jgi:hypothetical protein
MRLRSTRHTTCSPSPSTSSDSYGSRRRCSGWARIRWRRTTSRSWRRGPARALRRGRSGTISLGRFVATSRNATRTRNRSAGPMPIPHGELLLIQLLQSTSDRVAAPAVVGGRSLGDRSGARPVLWGRASALLNAARAGLTAASHWIAVLPLMSPERAWVALPSARRRASGRGRSAFPASPPPEAPRDRAR